MTTKVPEHVEANLSNGDRRRDKSRQDHTSDTPQTVLGFENSTAFRFEHCLGGPGSL
jgi:hypothetical protein